MKFITSLILAFALVTAAFGAANNKVSQYPTAEQLLPPLSAATGGFLLSSEFVNGAWRVKWVAPVQSDWLATSGPSFIKNKPAIVKPDWNAAAGSAGEILNKPIIPTPTPQVKSDWNAAAGTPAEILNKPTIPVLVPQVKADWNAPASSVAEVLNKPVIPAPQIQSDWNQTNTAAKDYVKNKPAIDTFNGVNAQVGIAYTVAASDANKVITLKNPEPIVLTIPADLAVADGTVIEGAQLDYGWVSIVAATNVKIISNNEAYKTDAIGSVFKLRKIAVNTWLLTGDLRSDKQTVPAGKTVILTSTALKGTTPFSYQWKKDGVDIAGATQVSLALYSVTAADAGVYVCTVTNTAGTTTSEQATIFVTL